MKSVIHSLFYILFPILLTAQNKFIDTSFGTEGFVIQSNQIGDFQVFSSDLTDQDEILVSGSYNNVPFVQKFMPDGQVDRSFGNQGLILLDSLIEQPNLEGHVQKLLLLDDNKLICLISGTIDELDLLLLVRLDLSGNLDTAFGDQGRFTFNAQVDDTILAEDIGTNESGDLFILAKELQGLAGLILKVNPMGQLDINYGINGAYQAALEGSRGEIGFANFEKLNIYPDGSVLAVGSNVSIGNRDISFHKLTPAGELDPSFGVEGIVRIDFLNEDDVGLDLLVADTAIFFCGGTTNIQGGISILGQLDESGQLNTNFGDNGYVFFQRDSLQFLGSFLRSYQNKVLIGGVFFDETFRNRWGIMAYDGKGQIQNVFQSEPKRIIVNFEPSSLQWAGLHEDKKGRLIATGFTSADEKIFMTRLVDPTIISSANSFSLEKRGLIQSLYPNPVKDQLHLRLAEHRFQLKKGTIRIVSMHGQVLSKESYSANQITQDLVVATHTLSPGMYFIQLYDAQNQQVGIGRFVKK